MRSSPARLRRRLLPLHLSSFCAGLHDRAGRPAAGRRAVGVAGGLVVVLVVLARPPARGWSAGARPGDG